jgi:uncharacterized protein YjiK
MHTLPILFIVLMTLVSCKTGDTQNPATGYPQGDLELIGSFETLVPEPSGLAFGPGMNTLLTVSDNTNQVFELDLQGKVLRVIHYGGRDLEGVAYNPDKNLIAVVDERDREVALINYDSEQVQGVNKINISVGSENAGLEGISYNSNNKLYYIVNETNPGLLVVWSPEEGIITQQKLNFAEDYSGIFVDSGQSLLWFVSDQSQKIYKCDYNSKVLMAFALDQTKYEGIVVNNDLVYVINDATARLNIYQIKNK